MKALQSPRWEDYEYEQIDAEDNVLYWLGDGQTWNEKSLTGDRTSTYVLIYFPRPDISISGAWYLSEEFIDRPPGTSHLPMPWVHNAEYAYTRIVPQD